MMPEALRRELERQGLKILDVGQHNANPEILVVYLHGNAGQWAGDMALQLVAQVPNVLAVTESVSSPTILLVRVTSSTE